MKDSVKLLSEKKDPIKPKWTLMIEPRESQYKLEEKDNLIQMIKNKKFNWIDFDGLNYENRFEQSYVIKVELPLLVRGNAISIELTQSLICIIVPTFYELWLRMPGFFERERGEAVFDCDERNLYLKLPIPETNSNATKNIDTSKLSQNYLYDLL